MFSSCRTERHIVTTPQQIKARQVIGTRSAHQAQQDAGVSLLLRQTSNWT